MAKAGANKSFQFNLGLIWLNLSIFQVICIVLINGQFLNMPIRRLQEDQNEQQLRQTLFDRYDNQVTPPYNASNPITLRCGFYLVSIRELDPLKQILVVEGWMKMSWIDSRLKWNTAKYMDQKKIHVLPAKLWIPDLTLYNRAKSSEVKNFIDSSTVVYSDGKVLWVPAATLYIICPIDLKYYPYDEHTCRMSFGSWTRDEQIIDVQLFDQVDILNEYSKGGEWEVVQTSSNRTRKYYQCCAEPYPTINYHLTLRRHSPLSKCTLLCPVIAGVLLTLAAFWVFPWSTERILFNGISLFIFLLALAQLFFKLPAAGPHVPLIVVFCESFLLLVTFTTICSLVFRKLSQTKKNTPVPGAVNFLLKSCVSKLVCIGHSSPLLIQPSEIKQLELTSEKMQNSEKLDQEENLKEWLKFYQLLDRIISVILVAVLVFVMIGAAAA